MNALTWLRSSAGDPTSAKTKADELKETRRRTDQLLRDQKRASEIADRNSDVTGQG